MVLVDNKNKIQYAMTTNNLRDLDKLALDDLKLVRAALTLNPNINERLLEQLSFDPEFVVKCGVAENSKTSKLTLTYLMNQESDGINFFILKNQNCPKEIVEKLVDSKNTNISAKALEKLSTFEHNLKDTIIQATNYSIDESISKNSHKHR